MTTKSPPRIALLGFSIECNKFAPPAVEADFSARAYAAGAELLLFRLVLMLDLCPADRACG